MLVIPQLLSLADAQPAYAPALTKTVITFLMSANEALQANTYFLGTEYMVSSQVFITTNEDMTFSNPISKNEERDKTKDAASSPR